MSEKVTNVFQISMYLNQLYSQLEQPEVDVS